jgi:hypothetical protein
MSSYASSDDDLFEYEYDEKEESKSSSSFVEDLNISSKIFKENNSIDSLDLDSKSATLNGNKIRLSLAYNNAFCSFVSEVHSQSVAKSFVIVLDTLTNGDFSLISKFYDLEMTISRKMLFLDLSHRSLNMESLDSSFAEQIFKALDVTFSEFYLNNFYYSTLDICEFSLGIDRAEYLVLSKKLGIPVQQFLFEDFRTTDESQHTVYLEDFRKYKIDSMFTFLQENNLLEEISNMYGKNVKVVTSSEEEY